MEAFGILEKECTKICGVSGWGLRAWDINPPPHLKSPQPYFGISRYIILGGGWFELILRGGDYKD